MLIDNNKMNKVIWAAGFFDGEGCISLVVRTWGNPRRNYRQKQSELRVTIAQVKLEPLLIYVELWGGKIRYRMYPNDRQKPNYEWRLDHSSAFPMLQESLPYLIVKRPQAEIALQFLKTVMNNKQRKKLSPEQWQEREGLAEQMKILNKRGL